MVVVLFSVHGFFSSSIWSAVVKLAIFAAFIFWLAIAYWVYKDARRRIEDPWLIGTSIVLGLVPYFGAIIYMLFRPPEYLEDVRERELEIKEMESRLGRREARCPVCQAEVDSNFVVCPICTTRLKQPCEHCKAPLEPIWQICPYCETLVAPQPTALLEPDTWETPPQPRLRESG
ncbi:MAG: zinc ribbon domain-containing protein [Gaiellaceae bacterium]